MNDAYSDSLQGANVGAALSDDVSLRVRLRHSNSHTGVPGEWNFNGYDPLVPVNGVALSFSHYLPTPSTTRSLNNILGSVELVAGASRMAASLHGLRLPLSLL